MMQRPHGPPSGSLGVIMLMSDRMIQTPARPASAPLGVIMVMSDRMIQTPARPAQRTARRHHAQDNQRRAPQ